MALASLCHAPRFRIPAVPRHALQCSTLKWWVQAMKASDPPNLWVAQREARKQGLGV